MKENHKNIGVICNECADQRKNEFQEKLGSNIIKLPCFVKLAFKQDVNPDNFEHMWVEVTIMPIGIKYVGTLYNDPFFITTLKFGDEVSFNREDIEDIMY